jgi:trehalose utilization protein
MRRGPVGNLLFTLVRKPKDRNYPAMSKNASAVSNDTSNRISRRTALGLGATVAAGVLFSPQWLHAATAKRKVVVWSEGTANVDPASKAVYPDDINTAIAEGLKPLEAKGWAIVKASLNDPDQGVSDDLLSSTDVLIWWGHKKHGDVKDELVSKIVERVKAGKMGFIATHSSHFCKPLKQLLGTPCTWGEYKADGTSVEIVVKEPNHPICKGVKDFKLPKIERYGEPFAVPTPEAVPLDGIYTRPDGQTQPGRMGLCWTIGKGKVFYFTPGHETYNDYYRPEIRRIFVNAVEWAAPGR